MMNDEMLIETCINSEEIYDGRLLHVFKDTVSLPNGSTSTREYIRHVGAAAVIPITDDGKVLMERQYRYPYHRVIREIPAGKLDGKGEDPLEAAKRELREETGYEAKEWISLGDFYPTCAYCDEVIAMYIARGLSLGEQDLDDDEFLDIEEVPLTELVEDVMAGRICDGKTIAGILKAWYYLTHR